MDSRDEKYKYNRRGQKTEKVGRKQGEEGGEKINRLIDTELGLAAVPLR